MTPWLRDLKALLLGWLGMLVTSYLLALVLVGIAMVAIGAPAALCWWLVTR